MFAQIRLQKEASSLLKLQQVVSNNHPRTIWGSFTSSTRPRRQLTFSKVLQDTSRPAGVTCFCTTLNQQSCNSITLVLQSSFLTARSLPPSSAIKETQIMIFYFRLLKFKFDQGQRSINIEKEHFIRKFCYWIEKERGLAAAAVQNETEEYPIEKRK